MAELFIVTPPDYPGLALFLASFHPQTESQAFWLDNFYFWWDHNPAFAQDFERGWLLRENEKIVGFLGCIPTCFQSDGQSLTVFNSTTWRVLPEARHQSMHLLSKLLSTSKHSIVFNTTPNEEVIQILKVLKFQPLPGLAEERRSVVIINFEKVLLSKLEHHPAKKLLVKLAVPALALLQWFRLRSLTEAKSIQVKQITEADASFDQLWSQTKDLYPHTNLRTAEIINWVCFRNKNLKKTVFGCYKDNQLCGYAIFETKFNKRHHLNILECLDLWFDPAGGKVIEAVAQAAQRYARTQAIDLLSFPHFNTSLDQYFSRLGLFQTQSQKNEYLKAHPRLAHHLTAEASYFVGLQGDTGLA